MRIINMRNRNLAFTLLLLGGLGLSACSTGTNDGDVSVEKSDYKDKNPTEHNVETKAQPSTDTTDLDAAYEKADKASDQDSDGKADQPGARSN